MGTEDGTVYFRLLDLLIEQTRLGNIHWESAGKHSFIYRGTNSSVGLWSVNGDGAYPVRFAIYDDSMNAVTALTTREDSEPDERFWDDRIRSLWTLVDPYTDPVLGLIQDLESLPPF